MDKREQRRQAALEWLRERTRNEPRGWFEAGQLAREMFRLGLGGTPAGWGRILTHLAHNGFARRRWTGSYWIYQAALS